MYVKSFCVVDSCADEAILLLSLCVAYIHCLYSISIACSIDAFMYLHVHFQSSSAPRQDAQLEAKLGRLQADVDQLKLLLKILMALLVLVIGLLLAK